jgi:hypothetical protein
MSGSGNALTTTEVQSEIDADLQQRAEDAGIDVEEVVEGQIEENGNYGKKTVVRFAESALNRQIEANSAELVSGILAGSRDRYGKNWPRRHALVKSDGDHIEASSWEASLPTTAGGETEIPSAAAVEMRVEYDDEYGSYTAKQLAEVNQLSKAELATRMEQVARHPSSLGRDDEYEMVVVKGEIAYINPQTVFEDGEPQGDGPIMLEDERGRPKPHFELVLEEEADTRLRAHVERQRYSEPLMAIEDFGALCRDAYGQFADAPDDQTRFVGDAMRGREVAVVGNVNKVDKSRGGKNEGTTKYIDIGVAGIIELDPDTDSDDAQKQPEPEPEPEPESDTDESDDDSLGDFEDIEHDDSDDTDDSPAADIDDVAADVQQYADLVGMDQSEITAEVIVENTAIDAPDSVIETAIERIGDDAPPADVDDDSDDEPDDPIETLRDDETGQLECPDPDCFANASGEAGLYGHVMGTHIPGDADPEEWVLEQIEG